MKRLILPFLMVLALFSMKAETTMTYGICSDNINGVGTGMGGSNYSAAIEVPEAVAQALKGSKVTNVSIGFKSGLVKIINVYLTYDLEGEPFYQQEGRVKVNSFNDQKLETPYIIEGRKFYIGYTYRQSSSTGKPIGFDSEDKGGMGAFSHVAIWPDGSNPSWDTYPQFGALSIRATIVGDKTLENCVIPVGLRLPKASGVGKEFSYEVDILNYSSNPVNSIGITTTFGSQDPIVYTEDLATALAPGQKTTLNLSGVSYVENKEMPVSIVVSKVNGVDNLWAANSSEVTFISSDYVYPRTVVIEEATGTGCGYCPAGYVAMEQMREKHKEDYIGIAVHNYSGDPMFCSSYEPWINNYITGYPNATINRSSAVGVFSPQPNICEANYQELAGMLNLHFYMQAEYADEEQLNARVATYVCFGYPVMDNKFQIALVETEDNVGPYSQYNGYSGGGSGDMYGFENEPRYVSLIYNDVARAIHNWRGKDGSLPHFMQANKTYTYEETIPLMTSKAKHGDMNLIALLIDTSTKEILTAAKCKPGKITGPEPDPNPEPDNSVSETATPTSFVYAADGDIVVEGSFEKAEIFSLDGRKVAGLDSPATVSVNAGIYVVRVSEGKNLLTKKLIVK